MLTEKTTISEITATTESVASWLTKPYVDDALTARMRSADVILVPVERFRDQSIRAFPAGTDEFLSFLKSHESKSLVVEVCSDDSNYQEIDLHSGEILWLCSFLVKDVALPLMIVILKDYLMGVLRRRPGGKEVRASITRMDSPTQGYELRYSGPLEGFIHALDTLKDTKREDIG